jgi:hypothetical protein
MTAKESVEMARARHMVLQEGKNQNQAAVATGLTRGAISKTAWYRAFKSEQLKKDVKK